MSLQLSYFDVLVSVLFCLLSHAGLLLFGRRLRRSIYWNHIQGTNAYGVSQNNQLEWARGKEGKEKINK